MTQFERPISQVINQERFGPREVGLTHPDVQSFIKLSDNGDIEISAGPGISIILHPQNKSITFVADSVKFLIKDHDSFKLNDLILNTDATKYSEPTFIKSDPEDISYLYDGTADYLEDIDYRKVIDPKTNRAIKWDEYVSLYKKEPVWNGLNFE